MKKEEEKNPFSVRKEIFLSFDRAPSFNLHSNSDKRIYLKFDDPVDREMVTVELESRKHELIEITAKVTVAVFDRVTRTCSRPYVAAISTRQWRGKREPRWTTVNERIAKYASSSFTAGVGSYRRPFPLLESIVE